MGLGQIILQKLSLCFKKDNKIIINLSGLPHTQVNFKL